MPILQQLEELQLITCSLLPGESFTFSEHCETAWSETLSTSIENPDCVCVDLATTIPPVCFNVSIESWHIWFQVELPRTYPEADVRPLVTVKGEDITRAEQEAWKSIVDEKLNEVLEAGSG